MRSKRPSRLGYTRMRVKDILLERHPQRRRNPGQAGWRVSDDKLAIVYEHPDGDDAATARIVSLWRRK